MDQRKITIVGRVKIVSILLRALWNAADAGGWRGSLLATIFCSESINGINIPNYCITNWGSTTWLAVYECQGAAAIFTAGRFANNRGSASFVNQA